jgi:hypothetical protein
MDKVELSSVDLCAVTWQRTFCKRMNVGQERYNDFRRPFFMKFRRLLQMFTFSYYEEIELEILMH